MGCGASKAKPPQPGEPPEASGTSAAEEPSETSVAPEAVRIQEDGGGGDGDTPLATTGAKAEELRVKLGLTAAPSEGDAATGASSSSEDDAATSEVIAQACAKLQVDPGGMTLAEQADACLHGLRKAEALRDKLGMQTDATIDEVMEQAPHAHAHA
eukprot:scaffold68065_cov57-Phaeocystis_antarctica.AAC.5